MDRFIAWFTEPHFRLTSPEERLRSQWISGSLLLLLPAAFLAASFPAIISPVRSVWDDPDFLLILIGSGALIAPFYVLSRFGFHKISAVILIFVALGAISIAMTNDDTGRVLDLYYVFIPLLLSGYFLSIRMTWIFSSATLALIIVFPLVNESVPLIDIVVGPFSFFILGLTMVILGSAFRSKIEKLHTRSLRRSLRERDTLLQEVHHRVKNNLQVIISLLNLQGQSAESEEAVTTLEQSRGRIYSIALLYEILYRSEELSNIDMGAYVGDLVNSLQTAWKGSKEGVIIETHIEDLHFDVQKATTCGLVINELVTNALKYGFPDGGKGSISVGITAIDGNSYLLCVRDSGIGFPEDADAVKLNRLGLNLVDSLCQQLEGRLKMYNDNGACVDLIFP